MEEGQGHISVYLAEGKGDVIITIPLFTAVKAILILVVALASALWLAWRCCGRAREEGRPAAQPGKAQEAAGGKQKPPKRPKPVMCEAGIQGPVHFNGTRYIHKNQGFQRGDEVTRVVASSGYRVPPGWEGRAAPDPRPHHE